MKQNRSNLALGLILLVVGGWLLVTRQVPSIQEWMDANFAWPMYTIGAGLLVLLIGLITGAPGLPHPETLAIEHGTRLLVLTDETPGDDTKELRALELTSSLVGLLTTELP